MDFDFSRLYIYKDKTAGPAEFVAFWSWMYAYPLEHLYNDYIHRQLSQDTIISLFIWKNGRKLSEKKGASVRVKYITQKAGNLVDQARRLPKDASLREKVEFAGKFLEHFAASSAIWPIFWLHCCNRIFPIDDMHVHRSMRFLKGQAPDELGKKKTLETIKLYLDEYLAFHARFDEFDDQNERRVDKALVTFGKFLKESGRITA